MAKRPSQSMLLLIAMSTFDENTGAAYAQKTATTTEDLQCKCPFGIPFRHAGG